MGIESSMEHQQVMRTVIHPGPVLKDRVTILPVSIARTETLVVQPGHDLLETVHQRLNVLDAPGAVLSLKGGQLERLTLMTGGAGTGTMPMSFRGPHTLNGPLHVVAGTAMSGLDAHGVRLTHCHAVFDDVAGQRVGGHLLIGLAIAGEAGVIAELTVLAGGRMRQRADEETGFAIFHPEVT